LFFCMSGLTTAFAREQTDTMRVACVGNSITAGWTTPNPTTDAYPVQLGVLLGKGWLVKNCGVSGRTMLRHGDFPIWNEQKFKDGLALDPDVVTILLGTNDSKSWNWIYKDEFVSDYTAMIDTFRALPSHPIVWLGLPLPAFRDSLGIRDSIITTDIIPMIQQIAVNKGCPVVDFYTAMKSHPELFSEGIHPNTEGSAVMAEMLYESLTGKTVTRVRDENAAAGRPVDASGSINPAVYGASNLVDGNILSAWKAKGFPSQAVVDLGSIQTVDLFRLDFGRDEGAGYQFSVETATVSGAWTKAVDRTARTDTAAVFLEKTNPIEARYVRLTVTGAVRPKGDTVSMAEFRVLKENGGVHAPVLSSQLTKTTKTYKYIKITLVWPNGADGAVMLYRNTSQGASFSSLSGFRAGGTFILTEVIRIGNANAYYAVSFLNGVETVSDTITIDTNTTAVDESRRPEIPSDIALLPMYPNPFNLSMRQSTSS
jgi:lysophospholipase L1-like esterase